MITVEKRASQLFFKPVIMIPNVIELSYYSNSLVPHFALESVMITALNTLAKEFEKKFPTKVSVFCLQFSTTTTTTSTKLQNFDSIGICSEQRRFVQCMSTSL